MKIINKNLRSLIFKGLKENSSGFTLIELLLSTFLFVLLLVAISGIYVSFSKVQARTNASHKVLNDSQYILEIMAREIRNDLIFDFSPADSCVSLVGADYENCLLLLKEDGALVSFSSVSDDLRYIVLDCSDDYSSCTISDSIALISSAYNDVYVRDLDFVITPSVDPYEGESNLHPKVTIRMQTESDSRETIAQINHYLQTTVSSRIYKR